MNDKCEHEPTWIDAGPYSDDIAYRVCKKCEASMTEPTAFTDTEYADAMTSDRNPAPESDTRQCTCPKSAWIGSEPNDSTCELTEEEHENMSDTRGEVTAETMKELEELERLANAATLGPWDLRQVGSLAAIATPKGWLLENSDEDDLPDKAYIAVASPDVILRLIETLESERASNLLLGEEIERLKAGLNALRISNRANLTSFQADCPEDVWLEAAGTRHIAMRIMVNRLATLRASASSERVVVLERALRDVMDERYSELDMMTCPYGSGSLGSDIWHQGVYAMWRQLKLIKGMAIDALSPTATNTEKADSRPTAGSKEN